MDMATLFPVYAGLNALFESLKTDWLGPAFLIVVAAITITLVIKREFRGLIAFGVVAIIGAIFIFFGDTFFGANGSLTKAAVDIANQVNTMLVTWLPFK
jgi:hypothetical protein